MAPKKPVKETVVYPASKSKALPFKPLRSSQPLQGSTRGSSSTLPKATSKQPPPKRRRIAIEEDDENESDQNKAASREDSDASDDLPVNPLAAKPTKATERPTPKRKPARDVSPMSVSSEDSSPERPTIEPDPPPGPSQSDTIPSIPQPLLVRLLHEHFADKTTKIDKNAIQVLEKYFEVFIRETIARAAQQKKQDMEEDGSMDVADASWLELEDLEKVAAGMMLDF